MRLKPGVSLANLQPQMFIPVMVVKEVFDSYGIELVITSGYDGQHSTTSLHYAGCALDFRTRKFLSSADLNKAVEEIRDRLTKDFDVVLESDHLHVEMQPRR